MVNLITNPDWYKFRKFENTVENEYTSYQNDSNEDYIGLDLRSENQNLLL